MVWKSHLDWGYTFSLKDTFQGTQEIVQNKQKGWRINNDGLVNKQ